MGKHVCPVCETIYAQRGVIRLDAGEHRQEYESWTCPACGYQFVAVSDLQKMLSVVQQENISTTTLVLGSEEPVPH